MVGMVLPVVARTGILDAGAGLLGRSAPECGGLVLALTRVAVIIGLLISDLLRRWTLLVPIAQWRR